MRWSRQKRERKKEITRDDRMWLLPFTNVKRHYLWILIAWSINYRIIKFYWFIISFCILFFLTKNSKCLQIVLFPRSKTVCEHPYDLLANHSHTLLLGWLGKPHRRKYNIRVLYSTILHFLQRIIKKFGLFNCAIGIILWTMFGSKSSDFYHWTPKFIFLSLEKKM